MHESIPRRFAHRGNHRNFPENSLEAFESAFSLGADGIELDVHLNKQGELIVVHNYLFDHSLQYPLLSQVFERFASKGHLEIEIKTFQLEALQKVATLIKEYAVTDYQFATSVIPLIPHIRTMFPMADIGIIFRPWLIEDWMTPEFVSEWIRNHLSLSGANVLHLEEKFYTEKLVEDLRKDRYVVQTHLKTANQEQWDRIKRLGLDQCTFDDLAVLQFR